MFGTIAGTIKGGIALIRVYMPNSLGAATYFLPHNLNIIIGFIVMARISVTLFAWIKTTMKRFAMSVY